MNSQKVDPQKPYGINQNQGMRELTNLRNSAEWFQNSKLFLDINLAVTYRPLTSEEPNSDDRNEYASSTRIAASQGR